MFFVKKSPTSIRLLLFVLVTALMADAQSSRTAGTIQGTVLDQTGSVIPAARVMATSAATNQSRSTVSNAEGSFRLAEMPPGLYEIHVEAPGFGTYVNRTVEVSIGGVATLTVTLTPAALQQQVTVSEAAPPIDVTQTTVATAIGPERIAESPVVTRNFVNFVLMAPSLSQSNPQTTVASATALSDSGFTFAGLRPRSNSLYIDGVENNDEFEGSVRTELSPETIHEFQVIHNGLSAESGGGAGGSINVITKSGANIHHGNMFLFVENGGLNAPLTNETSAPDLSKQRVGLAIGGPIIRDRTFYYLAGEQERSRGDDSSFISPAAASTINSLLAAGTFPRVSTRAVNPGTFRVERAETEASARLDHQITARHSLLLKYAFTNNREVGDAFNTSGLVDPSGRGSSFTRDQGLTAGVTSVLSDNAVNSASVQFSRRSQVRRTTDQLGPEIQIAGVVDLGRTFGGNGRRTEDHYEFVDVTSLVRGHHLIKLGMDVDRIHESSSVLDGFAGTYLFPTLNAFSLGAPDEYLQSWGNPKADFATTKYAAFLQEHWRATSRLTLDAGVRYEFEQLPSAFRQDANNFAPRVGLAFSPSAKWVLRGGFGIFYDRYVLAAANRVLQVNGAGAFQQLAQGALAVQVFQTAFGGAPAAPVAGIPPSIFTADRGLRTPYSEIANAGVERLISNNMTVSATYLFAHGVKLPRTVNTNLAPPTVLTVANASSLGFSSAYPQALGRPVFSSSRLSLAFGDIYEWQNQSSSVYHGASLALNRRLANDIEFSASYTLSKTIDDASDFNDQPQDPYNLRAERALSAGDQRHRFVFSGTFDLPFGEEEEGEASGGLLAKLFGNIETAPIVMIGSGRPVNPLTGFDANHSGAYPLSSRPLGWGRNSLRTPTQVEVDLRVLKFFKIGEHGKLDFVAEAFNLLNHTNVTGLNQFFGPDATPLGTFGQPNRAGIARQFQFSIDFEF